MSDMKQPSEPGWYITADGFDPLSFDGDAWHMHYVSAEPYSLWRVNHMTSPSRPRFLSPMTFAQPVGWSCGASIRGFRNP